MEWITDNRSSSPTTKPWPTLERVEAKRAPSVSPTTSWRINADGRRTRSLREEEIVFEVLEPSPFQSSTTRTRSDPDNSELDEQQGQAQSENQHQPYATASMQSGAATPLIGYMMPTGQLEAGQAMSPAAYPYMDPFYGGMFAAYAGQHVIHPQLIGVHHPGVPLPTDAVEEPVYVNAKQYHGILRRRQSRAKAESENKLAKIRKACVPPL
ncbi:hypothetical protein ZIOFF_065324 [Zingiber officinale]|uniref:Nuclear transcription factor Y subunit n=1 Tax=Zingiber officinale TaxID=94328 RepID=A0A8J5KD34_ZINOF|nr:hypothetical protein ZIOFF_065324 [Zingiber officinale]